MNVQTQVDGGLEVSVSAAFDVLSWEIELAGARCIVLDTIIGELMETMPEAQRARLLEGMHGVDLLGQHLTGLSAFARSISQSAPADVMIPVQGALDDITLGALTDRMTTAFGGQEKGINDGDDAGDLDLF